MRFASSFAFISSLPWVPTSQLYVHRTHLITHHSSLLLEGFSLLFRLPPTIENPLRSSFFLSTQGRKTPSQTEFPTEKKRLADPTEFRLLRVTFIPAQTDRPVSANLSQVYIHRRSMPVSAGCSADERATEREVPFRLSKRYPDTKTDMSGCIARCIGLSTCLPGGITMPLHRFGCL